MTKKHPNILRWFQDTVEERGVHRCLTFKSDKKWQSLNWLETLDKIQVYSEALKKIDIVSKDRVAVIAQTRYEWTIIDMAILSLGAITVPVYPSNLPEEVEYILNDSETRVVFVENKQQLKKVLEVWPKLSHLEKVVLIDGKTKENKVINLSDFEALGEGIKSDFGSRIRQIAEDDIATLVYTSGTTGVPKGVIITHENLTAAVESVDFFFELDKDWDSLLFLPLSHILGRVAHFAQLCIGFTHIYAESIDKLADNIRESKPHFIVGVPRIFEKVYQNMMLTVESSSSLKKKIFNWAVGVGEEYANVRDQNKEVSFILKSKYQLAYKLVFSKLHEKLGGRLLFFVSGGAPLNADIARFFYYAGILILEGYGLTETTAAFCANTKNDNRFGTVGKPGPGGKIKIAEDGEILVSGPLVAKGYWKKPEETDQVFSKDGWFYTGDVGEINDGFLRITDRKKDIIVTAGGKNIAPQKIENAIKTNPLVSQIMVHGDKRKYLTALLTLNEEEVKRLSKNWGLNGKAYSDIIQDSRIQKEVKRIIDQENKHLASYESIKRFAVVPEEFTIEGGELTPSLKVKRKFVSDKYKTIIDGLYNN